MTSSKNILSFTSVFFIFLFIRLWGIQFGLPYDGIHPTENFTVTHALHYVETSYGKPFDFQHPTLLQYLIALIARVCRILPEHYPYYYLIGRAVSALSSWGTVILLYFFSRDLFRSRFWGLASASLLGVSLVPVQYAHYAVPDSLSVFFLMGAVLSAQRIMARPSLSRYLACAVWCGLSIGSKFSGLLSAGFLLTAWLVMYRQEQPYRWAALSASLAVTLLVFGAVSPFHIVYAQEFLSDAARYFSQKGYTGDFNLFSSGYWVYPVVLIPSLTGIVTALCAGAGVAVLMKRYGRGGWLLSIPCILFYVIIGREKAGTLQNTLPLMPLISCGAVAWLIWCSRRNVPRAVIWALMAVMFLYPLAKSVLFDCLLQVKDTRVRAEEWMLDNLPLGAKVAGERYTPVDISYVAVPAVKEYFDTHEFMDGLGQLPAEHYRLERFAYAVTSGFREDRARFFCRVERKCATHDRYASFNQEAQAAAVFEPVWWARFAGVAQPWGTWPLQPRVTVYRFVP